MDWKYGPKAGVPATPGGTAARPPLTLAGSGSRIAAPRSRRPRRRGHEVVRAGRRQIALGCHRGVGVARVFCRHPGAAYAGTPRYPRRQYPRDRGRPRRPTAAGPIQPLDRGVLRRDPGGAEPGGPTRNPGRARQSRRRAGARTLRPVHPQLHLDARLPLHQRRRPHHLPPGGAQRAGGTGRQIRRAGACGRAAGDGDHPRRR